MRLGRPTVGVCTSSGAQLWHLGQQVGVAERRRGPLPCLSCLPVLLVGGGGLLLWAKPLWSAVKRAAASSGRWSADAAQGGWYTSPVVAVGGLSVTAHASEAAVDAAVTGEPPKPSEFSGDLHCRRRGIACTRGGARMTLSKLSHCFSAQTLVLVDEKKKCV